MEKNGESEGEELIAEFLENQGIDFKRQVELKLEDDTKSVRYADFYLPRYKIYLEFQGRWSNDEDRKRYAEKKKVYDKNGICCVYLFPDNLGVLNFILNKRIKKVLKNYSMKLELFKLNYDEFLEKYGLGNLIILGLIIFIKDTNLRVFFSIIFIVNLWLSFKKIFLK